MDNDSDVVLNYFFTNSDKPIFAFQHIPPSIQNYIYLGISRFPNLRERFLKILTDKNILEKVADTIRKNQSTDDVLKDINKFAAERNSDVFFNRRHGSSSEGSSVFVVSEQNPIFATEDQQDFYYPMTTMEFSTRYATRFDIDHVYWDPILMKSEFADEIRNTITKNFEIYKNGFDATMKITSKKQNDLTDKVSALDAIRFIIPLSAHTTIILGGNVRSVFEHFGKLIATNDNFMKYYVNQSLKELSKVIPGFFEIIKPDEYKAERNKKLREYANEIFKKNFKPVKEDVQLFYEMPLEELALTQIIYPFCCLPFIEIFDKISSFNENEKKELFELANLGRENRRNPIRGFETRHLVFEIETGWALWKDFKRNRMNLRFHQDTRGLAGFDTPEIVKESEIAKEYENAQKKTSELVEKVYQKFGNMSRIVGSQGSRKRYLLCMGPRQLTVLGELRTSGEGDKGYRRVASKMIELAKEKNSRLFGHIKNNFKIL
jgi:thymidylate synthase ThyX